MRSVWKHGLALLVFGGCALVQNFVKEPKVISIEPIVKQVSPEKIDLDLKLKVENSNAFTVPLKSISAKVSVNGQPAIANEWRDLPTLQSNAATDLLLPISIPWSGLATLGSALLGGKKDLDYAIDGSITAASLTFPYSQKGKVKLK